MFKTLVKAMNMFSARNMYYNVLDKRLLSNHNLKYSVSHIDAMCCNAIKKKCDCSKMCKKIVSDELTEKNFKCEITNMPPRKGYVDCNCEFMCMVKKSETMTVTESKKND